MEESCVKCRDTRSECEDMMHKINLKYEMLEQNSKEWLEENKLFKSTLAELEKVVEYDIQSGEMQRKMRALEEKLALTEENLNVETQSSNLEIEKWKKLNEHHKVRAREVRLEVEKSVEKMKDEFHEKEEKWTLEKKDLENEIEDLKEEFRKDQNQRNETKYELQRKVTRLESDLESLESDLEKANREAGDERKEFYIELTKTVSECKAKEQESNKKLRELQAAYDTEKTLKSILNNATLEDIFRQQRKQMTSLEEHLDESEKLRKDEQENFQKLMRAVEKENKEKLTSLEKELEEKNLKILEMKESFGDDEIKKNKEKLESLENQLKEKDSKISELESFILDRSNAGGDDKDKRILDLENEADKNALKVIGFQNLVAEKEKTIQEQKSRISNFQLDINRLEEALSKTDHLKLQVKNAKEEFTQLRQLFVKCDSLVKDQQKEIAALKSEKELSKKLGGLTSQEAQNLKDLQEKLTTANTQLENVNKELKETKALLEQLTLKGQEALKTALEEQRILHGGILAQNESEFAQKLEKMKNENQENLKKALEDQKSAHDLLLAKKLDELTIQNQETLKIALENKQLEHSIQLEDLRTVQEEFWKMKMELINELQEKERDNQLAHARELGTLQTGIRDLSNQLLEADYNYEQLDAKTIDVEKQLKASGVEMEKLKKELTESKNILAKRKTEEESSLNKLKTESQHALAHQKKHYDNAIFNQTSEHEKQVSDKNMEINKLRRQINNLEAKLKTFVDEELREFEAKMKADQERIRRLKRAYEE